jgi:hypothetical protein
VNLKYYGRKRMNLKVEIREKLKYYVRESNFEI